MTSMVQYLLYNSPQYRTSIEEDVMECPKCRGLMMSERFSDFFLIFYAWKCINCGSIIDRTISTNRRKSMAAPDMHPVPTR